jgi:hypothetical protein
VLVYQVMPNSSAEVRCADVRSSHCLRLRTSYLQLSLYHLTTEEFPARLILYLLFEWFKIVTQSKSYSRIGGRYVKEKQDPSSVQPVFSQESTLTGFEGLELFQHMENGVILYRLVDVIRGDKLPGSYSRLRIHICNPVFLSNENRDWRIVLT